MSESDKAIENSQNVRDVIDRIIPRKKPRERGYAKVGRNDPCPCGSSKKFKACCIETHYSVITGT